MELEYKEMKECTFTPKINTSRPKKKGSIHNIPGFDNFSRKIEKIQNKKVEEEKRNEKLFHLEKQCKQRKYTEPEGFHLSQGPNTKRALKAEL